MPATARPSRGSSIPARSVDAAIRRGLRANQLTLCWAQFRRSPSGNNPSRAPESLRGSAARFLAPILFRFSAADQRKRRQKALNEAQHHSPLSHGFFLTPTHPIRGLCLPLWFFPYFFPRRLFPCRSGSRGDGFLDSALRLDYERLPSCGGSIFWRSVVSRRRKFSSPRLRSSDFTPLSAVLVRLTFLSVLAQYARSPPSADFVRRSLLTPLLSGGTSGGSPGHFRPIVLARTTPIEPHTRF